MRLHLAIQTLSELWDTVNSQLQEKSQNSESHNYPLSFISMAEISFHRCKGKKQTNIKNAQSNTFSLLSPTSSPFSDPTTPLPPTTIPLPLPDIILFSFWFFVLFCIHKTNSKRSFLLYVVDVMERVSTPDYLESAISKYFSDLLLKSAYQLLQYFI